MSEPLANDRVAALTTPPPEAIDRSGSIRDYFVRKGSAPCFLAIPQSVRADGAAAQAFAMSNGRLDDFRANFNQTVGASLDLTPRIVSGAQCAAIDLARAFPPRHSPGPDLRLRTEQIANGGMLAADVSADGAGWLRLFIVDDEGLAVDVTSFATRLPDGMRLELPLRLTGKGGGKTQLLVALAADRPVSLLEDARPRLFAELLPLVLGEAKLNGVTIETAIAGFVVTP